MVSFFPFTVFPTASRSAEIFSLAGVSIAFMTFADSSTQTIYGFDVANQSRERYCCWEIILLHAQLFKISCLKSTI